MRFTLNKHGLTNIHRTSLTHMVEQEMPVLICRQSLTFEPRTLNLFQALLITDAI